MFKTVEHLSKRTRILLTHDFIISYNLFASNFGDAAKNQFDEDKSGNIRPTLQPNCSWCIIGTSSCKNSFCTIPTSPKSERVHQVFQSKRTQVPPIRWNQVAMLSGCDVLLVLKPQWKGQNEEGLRRVWQSLSRFVHWSSNTRKLWVSSVHCRFQFSLAIWTQHLIVWYRTGSFLQGR